MEESQVEELQMKIELEPWLVLIAYIVTVIGWYFARRSQLQADKRRYRADYLIEVMGAIAAGVNRRLNEPGNREFALGVESAIQKIQFLGTKDQVDLALEFLKNMKSKKPGKEEVVLAKLFTALRDELRREFRQEALGPIDPDDFPFLRF